MTNTEGRTYQEAPNCPRDDCGSHHTTPFGLTSDGERTYRCQSCERGFSEAMAHD